VTGRKVLDSHDRNACLHTQTLMPKPKGKGGASKGYSKNFKRRPAPKPEHDCIPESAIDREPDGEEPEGNDSTSMKTKISVPVAMWVCKITLHGDPHDLLRDVRTLGIATLSAAQERNFLALG